MSNNKKEREIVVKVVVCGDGAVGKTCKSIIKLNFQKVTKKSKFLSLSLSRKIKNKTRYFSSLPKRKISREIHSNR
jgi:hypothetical protein